MEHILHFFGGGCGEHMVWPWLAAFGSSFAVWIRSFSDNKPNKRG